MRLPSPTAVEVGVAAALSSQVVVYLIIESTCVTSRRAFSWTESSYTVGVIWGRPRFRKPRLEPRLPEARAPPDDTHGVRGLRPTEGPAARHTGGLDDQVHDDLRGQRGGDAHLDGGGTGQAHEEL